MRKLIEQINDRLKPYYSLLTMVFFFITSIISLFSLLSSPKDLGVEVSYEKINLPSTLQDSYNNVFNYIQQNSDDNAIKQNTTVLYKYLIDTQEQKTIKITNNTKEIINEINLRDCGVVELTSYGVSTSMKVSKESDDILKNIRYDSKSRILTVNEPLSLMPGETLYLNLWGSFAHGREEDNLFVNYHNKLASINLSKKYIGMAALLAEYYIPFFALLLMFIVVSGYYITKYAQNANKENASDNC